MKMHADTELSSELWSAGESERNSSSSQSEAFPCSRKRAAKRSVPEEQKDVGYWVRRQRNNAAARRSRETKRIQVSCENVEADYMETERLKAYEDCSFKRFLEIVVCFI